MERRFRVALLTASFVIVWLSVSCGMTRNYSDPELSDGEAGATGKSNESSGGSLDEGDSAGSSTGDGGRSQDTESSGGAQNLPSGGATDIGGAPGQSLGGDSGQAGASGGAPDTAHECVDDDDCFSLTDECWRRACELGECRLVAKVAGSSCGSAAETPCDSPDTCDGSGRCLTNHQALGKKCDDGLFCNGADTCEASGQCAHANDACQPGMTCVEATKHCQCAKAGLRVAGYCGVPSESIDRNATAEATEECKGCGTPGYVRRSSPDCMDFYCQE
jgi:hypothetical protein